MKRKLRMRHLIIFASLAVISYALNPPALVAGENDNIDGCLTSLYNYPAKIPSAARLGQRGEPIVSLNTPLPKDLKQTQRVSKNATPVSKK